MPARARARRPGWRGAAAAGLAALLLAACATVPDSGPAQAGKLALTAGGQGQDYMQPIPVPPKRGWTPAQVVAGFLAACASFANNHAVAREYLDPAKRRSWNPGWAVTVVGGAPKVGRAVTLPAHQSGSLPSQMEQVTASGEKLATLTNTGQYRGRTGSSTYKFQLYKIGGQWRIENPPPRLLLAEHDFKRVYAPRNLYYAAGLARALVPDPVFVPLQATSASLVSKLVTALLQRPKGWLESGVSTAFPSGTRLLRVALIDGTATINLGGSAARAAQAKLGDMTSQLAWTLAGPSYGQSAIQAVQLEINGHPRRSASLPGGHSGLSVPEPPSHTPLYSVAGNGAVQELTGPAAAARAVPGEAGQGDVPLSTIAASPSGHYVAGFSRSRKVVYYGPMWRGARLTAWRPYGGRVTSLSWDVQDDLWAASSGVVWMLTPGTGNKTQVIAVGTSLPNGSRVSQLRVAPDGVRVAMIAHEPGKRGSRLLLAAIIRGQGGAVDLGPAVSIGTDVPDPAQLTWYDADNLIVLSPKGLEKVAVNGSSSDALNPDSGMQSITAAGPANPMAAGLAHGQLALESSLNGNWVSHRGIAWSPVYPG